MTGDPTLNSRHLAFLFASLTASAIAGDQYLVFFGTYTNAKSPSKGIYRATFNAATGDLGKPELAAELGRIFMPWVRRAGRAAKESPHLSCPCPTARSPH